MTIIPVYLKRNQAGLVLGDLTLSGVTTDAAGNVFQIDAQDAETTWGNPIPVDVAVQRWMTDGAVASTQGHENREIFFKIVVSAKTSVALAAGEAALAKMAGKPTTLTWTPPEGAVLAPATVFEVWTWHLEPEFDGSREVRLARMYGVRATAKPWARSKNLTTVTALAVPGSPTTTLVDNCTVITGWTGSPNTPTVFGATAIRETVAITGGVGSSYLLSLTRTGSVTGLGTTPYLMLDTAITGGAPIAPGTIVQIDGVSIAKIAQIGTVSYWQVPAGTTSFTTLTVIFAIQATKGTGNVTAQIADVSKTDTIGGVGSRKQLVRHLDVGGSVKTSGSIQIVSPSTALGTCLAYTYPDDGSGYTPPLRQFRTSGNTVTPDSTCASGNHEAFVNAGVSAGTITYTIPAGLLPEGQYVVVGRFQFGIAATITVTMTSTFSTMVGKASQIGLAPGWAVIGAISLPGTKQPAESTTSTVITVSGTANTGTHTLDELYLLNVTTGSFTLVSPFNSLTKMWIDAPDADIVRNLPAIYGGSAADRSDAAAPLYTTILSVGDHDLDPAGAMVFTVTDLIDNAAVSATFYHRWHTHAGD